MDKVVMEMEFMEEGYLVKILVLSGDADDISVGKAVCVMCENEEDVVVFKDYVVEEMVEMMMVIEMVIEMVIVVCVVLECLDY